MSPEITIPALSLEVHWAPPGEDGGAAEAWFLPGADAAAWLRGMAGWGVPLETWTLYPLPPEGVLAVAGPGMRPRAPAGLPFTACGALWLPLGAVLSPPLAPGEVAALLPCPLAVWHPRTGFCGFASAAGLRVADLIAPPVFRQESWNGARPVPRPNDRLRSLRLFQILPPEGLFGDESRDIGRDAPRSADGRAGVPGLNFTPGAGERAADAAGRALHAAGLGWAGALVQRAGRALQSRRLRELDRLLHLLQHDPDEALRRALPLGASGLHRGRATPGDRLGGRVPDFRLGKVGHSGPVDGWDVPHDVQRDLRAHYLRLATREKEAGRHRRAAYIFAELLGDLASAATVLREGRHFREAAVLYRDHLRNPAAAAGCLREGGWRIEAIRICEELEDWLQAGEIHEEIGQPIQARACYQLAVEARRKAGDRLGAATLLEHRLHDPVAALTEMLAGFPDAWQQRAAPAVSPAPLPAPACRVWLLAALDLAARHRWPGRALTLLQWFRRSGAEGLDVQQLTPFLTLLTGVARAWPDESVRHLAAVTAVEKSTRLLASRKPAMVREAANVLTALYPDDPVYARDLTRHLAAVEKRSGVKPALVTAPGGKLAIQREESWQLACRWPILRVLGAASLQREYFVRLVCGPAPGRAVLLRGSWQERVAQHTLNWPEGGGSLHGDVIAGRSAVLLPGTPRTERQRFPKDSAFAGQPEAGLPPWLPDDIFRAAFTEEGVAALRRTSDGFTLTLYRTGGEFLGARALTGFSPDAFLVTHGGLLFVAGGDRLLLMRGVDVIRQWRLDSPACSLAVTPAFARAGAIVGMESGAMIFWQGVDHGQWLDQTITRPLVGFTHKLHGIAVNGETLTVGHGDHSGIKARRTEPWTGPAPVALLPCFNRVRFATITAKGLVQQFRAWDG